VSVGEQSECQSEQQLECQSKRLPELSGTEIEARERFFQWSDSLWSSQTVSQGSSRTVSRSAVGVSVGVSVEVGVFSVEQAEYLGLLTVVVFSWTVG
jgi:hypothetical protein